MPKFRKTDNSKSISFILIVSAVIVVVVLAIPLIKLLATHDGREKIKGVIESVPLLRMLMTTEGLNSIQDKVKSFGAFGALLFVALQVVQIIIAFIPGEPIEIIGGVLFGAFGGLFLCLIGSLVGTVLVYYLVKWLGRHFVTSMVDNRKIHKLKILNDEKKLETLIFILFLIPGTPKDLLTYFVPLTKIRPEKYFIYSTVARIPSIITSTFVGANIGKGHFLVSVVIFLITAAIGLVGILYNDRIVEKIKLKKNSAEIQNTK